MGSLGKNNPQIKRLYTFVYILYPLSTFIHLFCQRYLLPFHIVLFSPCFSFFLSLFMSMSTPLLHLAFASRSLCSLFLQVLSISCFLHYPLLSFSSHFFCSPYSSLPLAANPERSRPFCGGWGKVDTMWPRRAASPHRAGPQPGVTDGFFLLFSSAVEHRHTWWNHPAAIQGGETTVTVQDQGVSCWFILNWMHYCYAFKVMDLSKSVLKLWYVHYIGNVLTVVRNIESCVLLLIILFCSLIWNDFLEW